MKLSKSGTDAIQFWVLNIASFVSQLTISMVNLTAVYYLREKFRLTADLIGLITSVTSLCYLIFCIAGSSFFTRFRPRHLVETSLLGMAASVALFSRAATVPVAVLALACFGSFMSLLWPQIEGWFSRGKEGKHLNHVSNAFNLSWSIGTGLSSYIAGILVERSVTLPLRLGVLLFSAVFLLVSAASLLVPGIRAVGSERSENAGLPYRDESTPLRYYCWINLMIMYFGMSVILTVFPLYAMEVLHVSESVTGLLLLVRGVTTSLTFMVLAATAFWQFNRPLIIVNLLAFACICLAASSFSSLAAYGVLFFLFGIVFAAGYEQSMFHGVSGCRNRSQRMVVHEVLLTIGSIVGAVAGGYLYERFSFPVVLRVFGTIGLVAAVSEAVFAFLSDRRSKTA